MSEFFINFIEHNSITAHMIRTSWIKEPCILPFSFIRLLIRYQQHLCFFIKFHIVSFSVARTFITKMSKSMTLVTLYGCLIEIYTTSTSSPSSVSNSTTTSSPSYVTFKAYSSPLRRWTFCSCTINEICNSSIEKSSMPFDSSIEQTI